MAVICLSYNRKENQLNNPKLQIEFESDLYYDEIVQKRKSFFCMENVYESDC